MVPMLHCERVLCICSSHCICLECAVGWWWWWMAGWLVACMPACLAAVALGHFFTLELFGSLVGLFEQTPPSKSEIILVLSIGKLLPFLCSFIAHSTGKRWLEILEPIFNNGFHILLTQNVLVIVCEGSYHHGNVAIKNAGKRNDQFNFTSSTTIHITTPSSPLPSQIGK